MSKKIVYIPTLVKNLYITSFLKIILKNNTAKKKMIRLILICISHGKCEIITKFLCCIKLERLSPCTVNRE